jgi:serine/threonine protein phosphatase PrpC
MTMSDALPPPSADVAPSCPTCGESIPPDTVFCEACGAPVVLDGAPVSAPSEPPVAVIDPRDHLEQVEPGVVGVTDRGLRHHRNEDAMAFAVHESGASVLVVCDGVSSTQVPEQASQAAADAALASLLTSLDIGRDLTMALHESVSLAQAAASAVPWDHTRPPGAPSCTFVAAIVRDLVVTVAWVGDSRAYLITGNDSIRLTNDHSWAGRAMAAGATEEEAMADPRAHSITNWLGWDHEHQPAADVVEYTITSPSRVLVCSDGLWNYAGSAGELAALINRAEPADTLGIATSLVAYANESGGHDNITVVLTDILGISNPQPT